MKYQRLGNGSSLLLIICVKLSEGSMQSGPAGLSVKYADDNHLIISAANIDARMDDVVTPSPIVG